jgi:hypothetical protein
MRARAAALPAVLFAMALVSALVVGSVHTARTLRKSARQSHRATALRWPVERVLVDLIAHWDTAGRTAMPIGGVVLEAPTAWEGVPVRVSVTRLNEHVYWMVAEADDSASPHVWSRLGVLVEAQKHQIRLVAGPAWTQLP